MPCSSLATPPPLQQPSVDPSPAQSPMSVDSDAIGNEAALDVRRRVSASSDQNDSVSKPTPLANGKCVCVCVYSSLHSEVAYKLDNSCQVGHV